MKVQLSKEDRIVLDYQTPEKNNHLLVVLDGQGEEYVMLWRTSTLNEGDYELQWRGSLETVLDKFHTEVESFERDYQTDKVLTRESSSVIGKTIKE